MAGLNESVLELAAHVAGRFGLAWSAYPEGELEFMCATVEDVRPDAIFEWGTGSGASGNIFWQATDLLGSPTVVFSVDLPDELAPLEAQHPREKTGQYLPGGVERCRGDGVTESLVAWTRLQPVRSLFFLDGDHTSQAVYREVALIDRMVPGAVMLLHDTNGDGPGAAAEEWVARQGRHRYTCVPGRTGVGRLDPL